MTDGLERSAQPAKASPTPAATTHEMPNQNKPAEALATFDELKVASADAVREAIRSGRYRGQTAGLAAGKLQANVAILGNGYADDFLEFCEQNSQPCPLVGLTGRGDAAMAMLGDIDVRTDVASYNIYRHAELIGAVHDIADLWQDDFVGFALGCSFTFERALGEAGIPLPHIERNKTVAMYRTSLPLRSVGPFNGTMVVSMRPMPPELVDVAADITSRYPHAHGSPVHVGAPDAIGIADLMAPDWGDAPDIAPGDTAVFWACGVTPQNVLADARPPICITHTPGRMLVSDVSEDRMPEFVHAIV